MYRYIYTCISIYSYMYTCIYTYIYMYIYIYIQKYIYICIYVYVYIYMYAYTCTALVCVYVHANICTNFIRIYIHTYRLIHLKVYEPVECLGTFERNGPLESLPKDMLPIKVGLGISRTNADSQ